MTSRSQQLFERARKHIPGGVNSPVRAFASVGGTPPFLVGGRGSRVTDAGCASSATRPSRAFPRAAPSPPARRPPTTGSATCAVSAPASAQSIFESGTFGR